MFWGGLWGVLGMCSEHFWEMFGRLLRLSWDAFSKFFGHVLQAKHHTNMIITPIRILTSQNPMSGFNNHLFLTQFLDMLTSMETYNPQNLHI